LTHSVQAVKPLNSPVEAFSFLVRPDREAWFLAGSWSLDSTGLALPRSPESGSEVSAPGGRLSREIL